MNFTPIFRNKILAPLVLGILSILIAFILNIYFSEEQKIPKLILHFQNEIYQQEEKLNNALEKISIELKNDTNYEILNFAIEFFVALIVFTLTEHYLDEYRQRKNTTEIPADQES